MHKDGVKTNVLLPITLLQLPSREDHVRGAASHAESSLDLWEKVTFQVFVETLEQDAGQKLPSNRKQGDVAVVVSSVPVPFALLEIDNGAVLMFL